MYNENELLKEEVRTRISETEDASQYETLTGILWKQGEKSTKPFQLKKFEGRIECGGVDYYCVLIVEIEYDEDNVDEIVSSEDVFFEIIP